MRTIVLLFIILLLLIAYAVSLANMTRPLTHSAPASSRATYTPAPEVTPAPTYAPAYPGPAEQPQERRNSHKATPVPDRGGLRCGHC